MSFGICFGSRAVHFSCVRVHDVMLHAPLHDICAWACRCLGWPHDGTSAMLSKQVSQWQFLKILSVESTGLSISFFLLKDGISFGISNVPPGWSLLVLHWLFQCSIFVQLHEGSLSFILVLVFDLCEWHRLNVHCWLSHASKVPHTNGI